LPQLLTTALRTEPGTTLLIGVLKAHHCKDGLLPLPTLSLRLHKRLAQLKFLSALPPPSPGPRLLRHSQRKRGETARLDLRNTAPVLDPTGLDCSDWDGNQTLPDDNGLRPRRRRHNNAPVTTYVLTVDSANPASEVTINAALANNNNKSTGTTSFTLTYSAGSSVTLTAPSASGSNPFSS
jgi:hypothetical protein